MKKQTAKKGWILGLLVGWVMLVGVSPAMAGYFKIADLSDNDNKLAKVQAVIDHYESTANPNLLAGLCTTLVSSVKIEFTDDAGNVIIGSANFPYTADGITLTNGNFNTDDEILSGEWSSTFAVSFFSVKAGSGYELLAWDGIGSNMEGSWLSTKGTSHMSFFATECPNVPIPGAVWLLGSGLCTLLLARRRRKQV